MAASKLTRFTAGGKLHDSRDVIVGSTNASLFAYVADGVGGLKVLQLTSPDSQKKFYGFSPEPKPELIASYRTSKPALSLSIGAIRWSTTSMRARAIGRSRRWWLTT